MVILIAREREYFISIYNNDFICTMPPQHIIADQLKDVDQKENSYIITDAPTDVVNQLSGNIKTDIYTKIDLSAWLFYASKENDCNKSVNLSTAEPFYLKQVYTHK